MLIIESEVPEEPLLQVVQHFRLAEMLHLFSRFLICNGSAVSISKEEIADHLKQNTRIYYNESWQCESCQRIYWKGAHYHRMRFLIKKAEQAGN